MTVNWKKKLLQRQKKRSIKSEDKLAKQTGGLRQIGSGALRHAKGDVKHEKFLFEDKFTDKKSYSLKFETFDKIRKEAMQHAKQPAMRITIQERTLFVIEERAFLDMMNGNL